MGGMGVRLAVVYAMVIEDGSREVQLTSGDQSFAGSDFSIDSLPSSSALSFPVQLSSVNYFSETQDHKLNGMSQVECLSTSTREIDLEI